MSRDDNAETVQIVQDITRALTTCASCGERFFFGLMDARRYDGCCSDECAEALRVRLALEYPAESVPLPPLHLNCRCVPGKQDDE